MNKPVLKEISEYRTDKTILKQIAKDNELTNIEYDMLLALLHQHGPEKAIRLIWSWRD